MTLYSEFTHIYDRMKNLKLKLKNLSCRRQHFATFWLNRIHEFIPTAWKLIIFLQKCCSNVSLLINDPNFWPFISIFRLTVIWFLDFNIYAVGILNFKWCALNNSFGYFLSFLVHIFINQILLKIINENFRCFSRKYVIKIFFKIILWKWTNWTFYDDVIFRDDLYLWPNEELKIISGSLKNYSN